jgi:hypothetical protein
MYALAILLALVLGSAAAHKLMARPRLAQATGRLLGLNEALALPTMLGVAAIEVIAAIAILIPPTQPLGALIALLLWSGYALALHLAHRRGDGALDCGCSFGKSRHGIDQFTRLRPIGLSLLAIALMSFPGVPDVIAPFAGLALFAMYLAAAELAALPSLSRSAAR